MVNTESHAKWTCFLIGDFRAIPYSWDRLDKRIYRAKMHTTLRLVTTENINSVAFRLHKKITIH